MLETGTVSHSHHYSDSGHITIGSIPFEMSFYITYTGAPYNDYTITVHDDSYPYNVNGVALAIGVSAVSDITDASIFDIGHAGTHLIPREGEFIVLKNNNDYYAVLAIVDANSPPPFSDSAYELTFDYYIQKSKSIDFSSDTHSNNTAPISISLSFDGMADYMQYHAIVAENAAGAVVGTIAVTDTDAGDSHTLLLSGSDAGQFEIASDQLKLRSGVSADYETQSSYSVTVTATDSGGLSKNQAFTIGVTDVVENTAPTAINLSNSNIAEKSNGAVVGTLSVTDSDTDDTHTLTLSGYHSGLFEVSNNQLKLRSGVSADYETQSSYSVTVTATDSGGLSKSQDFTIGVTNQNRAPTAINLSNSNIAEKSNGVVVGTLSVSDPDTNDTHTLTLSGYHAGLFEVSNNQLKLRSGVSADYDTQSSYSVTVTATDSGGLSKSQAFTIGVTDVVENTAPTAINLSNSNIAEKSNGAVVGTLSVTDPDTDDTHTLSLSGSHGWLFEVSNNQLKLRSGVSADYETQSSYSVTVTATDAGGLSKSQAFTIGVTNKNSAPTAITLDSTTVAENAVASHIANISGVDPDEDDLTYSITGGSDAASFEIVNGMLHLAVGVSANYETQSSYSVTLTATDLEGLTYNEAFIISITDVEEASTLYGSTSNDTLDGFSGYEIIDGGDGLDTAKYSVASDAVSFSANDAGQLVIQNSANASLYTGKNADLVESDTLVSMERIQFSDKNYALDLDDNAGVAAKAVITCFGQESLDLYMSAGLTLADGGSTLDEICELVAGMGYIESIKGISTNSSFVDFIFENVVGRVPNFLESAMYTAYLDDGAYTKGSLLTLAANTSLVDKLLTENAVDLIGVAGSADGEILALQYDIGLG